jgi:hypothetical protein
VARLLRQRAGRCLAGSARYALDLNSRLGQQRIALEQLHERIRRRIYDFLSGRSFRQPFLINSCDVRVTNAKLPGGFDHPQLGIRIEDHIQFESEF